MFIEATLHSLILSAYEYNKKEQRNINVIVQNTEIVAV